MRRYLNKKELYGEVDKIRQRIFKCTEYEYPFPLADWIKHVNGLSFESLPFKTKALRGMAVIAEKPNQNHVILLNSNLSVYEQNFYCGHELVHLCLHRDTPSKQFNCYDKVMPNQDPFLEWQANEGAAEFLVPYKILFPLIKEHIDEFNDYGDIYSFKLNLSNEFMVTETVIEIRLESLKYEIMQYINGVNIENINFLSRTQQKRLGIKAISLNDIENKWFRERIEQWKASKNVS